MLSIPRGLGDLAVVMGAQLGLCGAKGLFWLVADMHVPVTCFPSKPLAANTCQRFAT